MAHLEPRRNAVKRVLGSHERTLHRDCPFLAALHAAEDPRVRARVRTGRSRDERVRGWVLEDEPRVREIIARNVPVRYLGLELFAGERLVRRREIERDACARNRDARARALLETGTEIRGLVAQGYGEVGYGVLPAEREDSERRAGQAPDAHIAQGPRLERPAALGSNRGKPLGQEERYRGFAEHVPRSVSNLHLEIERHANQDVRGRLSRNRDAAVCLPQVPQDKPAPGHAKREEHNERNQKFFHENQ